MEWIFWWEKDSEYTVFFVPFLLGYNTKENRKWKYRWYQDFWEPERQRF